MFAEYGVRIIEVSLHMFLPVWMAGCNILRSLWCSIPKWGQYCYKIGLQSIEPATNAETVKIKKKKQKKKKKKTTEKSDDAWWVMIKGYDDAYNIAVVDY